MNRPQNEAVRQPDNYFTTSLSATHNPLISTLQIDTLTNVHDVLYALKTLTDVQDFGMNEDTRTSANDVGKGGDRIPATNTPLPSVVSSTTSTTSSTATATYLWGLPSISQQRKDEKGE